MLLHASLAAVRAPSSLYRDAVTCRGLMRGPVRDPYHAGFLHVPTTRGMICLAWATRGRVIKKYIAYSRKEGGTFTHYLFHVSPISAIVFQFDGGFGSVWDYSGSCAPQTDHLSEHQHEAGASSHASLHHTRLSST